MSLKLQLEVTGLPMSPWNFEYDDPRDLDHRVKSFLFDLMVGVSSLTKNDACIVNSSVYMMKLCDSGVFKLKGTKIKIKFRWSKSRE